VIKWKTKTKNIQHFRNSSQI